MIVCLCVDPSTSWLPVKGVPPPCPMALWHLGQASAPVLWMDAFEIPGKYSKLLLNNKLLLFVPNLAVTQMAT